MPKNFPDISRPAIKPGFNVPVERDLGILYNCKIIVFDQDGELVENAYVSTELELEADTLMIKDILIGDEGYTNEKGYVIFNTSEALYEITVQKNGYQIVVKTISIKKNEILIIKLNEL